MLLQLGCGAHPYRHTADEVKIPPCSGISDLNGMFFADSELFPFLLSFLMIHEAYLWCYREWSGRWVFIDFQRA
jgi:hypothetical protein